MGFTGGLVVMDYHQGWESRGAQLFLENPGDFNLKTVVESGSYAVFSPDCGIVREARASMPTAVLHSDDSVEIGTIVYNMVTIET